MPHHRSVRHLRSALDLPVGLSAYVYGAGQAGRTLAAYLHRAGHPAAGFVDTHCTVATEPVTGLPVLPPAAFTDRRLAPERSCVLIASFAHVGIARTLREIKDLTVFDAYAFAMNLIHESRRLEALIVGGGIDLARSE